MTVISNQTPPRNARIRCFAREPRRPELILMMPEPRLRPLLQRFGAMLLEIPVFAGVYGVI